MSIGDIIPLRRPLADVAGFDPRCEAPTVGAAQRAALARGLAFALALAVSGLTLVYGPAAVEGARGGVPDARAAGR